MSKNGRKIAVYDGSSLPVGILPRVEASQLEHTIAQGDLLVMMSDGLYELNDDGFQWEQIISCLPTTNPQLAAEYLLAIATSRARSNQKKNRRPARWTRPTYRRYDSAGEPVILGKGQKNIRKKL